VIQRAAWIVEIDPRKPGRNSRWASVPTNQKASLSVIQRIGPGLRRVTETMWFCAQ
jgi:hypothetical protein